MRSLWARTSVLFTAGPEQCLALKRWQNYSLNPMHEWNHREIKASRLAQSPSGVSGKARCHGLCYRSSFPSPPVTGPSATWLCSFSHQEVESISHWLTLTNRMMAVLTHAEAWSGACTFLILLLCLGHSAENQPRLGPWREKHGSKSYIRNHLTTSQFCGYSANRLHDPQIHEQAQVRPEKFSSLNYQPTDFWAK